MRKHEKKSHNLSYIVSVLLSASVEKPKKKTRNPKNKQDKNWKNLSIHRILCFFLLFYEILCCQVSIRKNIWMELYYFLLKYDIVKTKKILQPKLVLSLQPFSNLDLLSNVISYYKNNQKSMLTQREMSVCSSVRDLTFLYFFF